MTPNASLDHWPPPLPHPEGTKFAWEAMHAATCDLLINTCKVKRPKLKKSSPKHLILEILDTCLPGQPLSIIHGLEQPNDPTRHPWWIRPSQSTFEILKHMSLGDRIQLAQLLCYNYAGDEWETPLLAEALDDPKQMIGEEDDETEQWTVHYDWENQVEDKEKMTDVELMELYSSSDFREHMRAMTQLRTLYRAILSNTLEEANLFLF